MPDLEANFTTAGKVEIHIKTLKDIKQDKATRIQLHSNQLDILEGSISITNTKNPTEISVIGHEYDLDRNFYVIHLAEVLVLSIWSNYLDSILTFSG